LLDFFDPLEMGAEDSPSERVQQPELAPAVGELRFTALGLVQARCELGDPRCAPAIADFGRPSPSSPMSFGGVLGLIFMIQIASDRRWFDVQQRSAPRGGS
jgi:hypothetical protein